MEKILIISLLLLLTSCSIDWNWEKDKKIAELEKQVLEMKKEKESDLYEKKKDCMNNENKALGFLQKWDEIHSIFYSKILNSCIISFIRYETIKNDDFERDYPVHVIRDIYTMEWILNETDAPKWEQKIKELKWE